MTEDKKGDTTSNARPAEGLDKGEKKTDEQKEAEKAAKEHEKATVEVDHNPGLRTNKQDDKNPAETHGGQVTGYPRPIGQSPEEHAVNPAGNPAESSGESSDEKDRAAAEKAGKDVPPKDDD